MHTVTHEALLTSMTTIAEVCLKQERGEYPMETVPCYCGASSPRLIAAVDRYAMPCHTNLCQACGLLYVNPRMTAEAYQSFYANEYRKIYLTNDDPHAVPLENGEVLWEMCEFYDVVPRSVIDLGCGTGETLQAFLDHGCRVLGVDQDPAAISVGLASGLPVEVGSSAPLGMTADLVILHHVLEHCLDLSATLAHARQLLTPNGVLYIGVPGIEPTPISRMFQTAHVYHFNADTLEYVMECEGWQAIKLDEQIVSLWKPSAMKRRKYCRSEWAARNVWDILGGNPTKLQEPRTHNKFPVKMQKANIKAMLTAGLPDFSMIRNREQGQQAIILGGGPSIDTQIEMIRLLIAQGARVVAIERMAGWCRLHGIIPDYVVVLDASEDVPESVKQIHPKSVCLTATQCGQAVVDALKGHHEVYCFSTPSSSLDMPSVFRDSTHNINTVLCVGASVTHAAMAVSMALGMDDLHIFGFDCHMTELDYAKGITGVGLSEPHYLDIEVEGRAFRTTGPYFSFVHQFLHLIETCQQLGFLHSVHVYGDSLITAMGSDLIAEINRRGTT